MPNRPPRSIAAARMYRSVIDVCVCPRTSRISVGLRPWWSWDGPSLAACGIGATYCPREWIDLLEADGRQVLLFRLSVERATWAQRVTSRRAAPSPSDVHHYGLIEHDAGGVRFPGRARLPEIVIDTTQMPAGETARIVLGFVQSSCGPREE